MGWTATVIMTFIVETTHGNVGYLGCSRKGILRIHPVAPYHSAIIAPAKCAQPLGLKLLHLDTDRFAIRGIRALCNCTCKEICFVCDQLWQYVSKFDMIGREPFRPVDISWEKSQAASHGPGMSRKISESCWER